MCLSLSSVFGTTPGSNGYGNNSGYQFVHEAGQVWDRVGATKRLDDSIGIESIQRMNRAIAVLNFVVVTASAQSTTEQPRFEVASIQRSATTMNPFTFVSGGVQRGERYELRKATMLDLIRIAWDVDPNIVFGGPDWLEFDQFDIAAKAPPGTAPSKVRLMLQSLLAERFGLVVHHDTRPMPSFVLAQGKNQSKLSKIGG